MNWDAIGAIGQMLGSLAVFVTLGYLAVQIKHARGEVRRSISQSRTETGRELSMYQSQGEWLLRAAVKADAALGGAHGPYLRELVDRAGLTPEEAYAVMFNNFAWWNSWSQQILRVNELTVGERTELDGFVHGQYASGQHPSSSLWYEMMHPFLNSDAVRYIDNLLAQPG
jgi:hypothetical protein